MRKHELKTHPAAKTHPAKNQLSILEEWNYVYVKQVRFAEIVVSPSIKKINKDLLPKINPIFGTKSNSTTHKIKLP